MGRQRVSRGAPADQKRGGVGAADLRGTKVAILAADGTVNPDKLRLDSGAVAFVKEFVASGKPVAAICHGPWTLLEAGVLCGRTVTSYPSIRTDMRNAGATVVDQEVATDGKLITSRSPKDLPAFCAALIDALAAGHQRADQREKQTSSR